MSPLRLSVPEPGPGLELLTGPDATELLNAALEPAGGRLLTWRLNDIDSRPGDRTTVSYAATVRWADGEREETLAATTSLAPPQARTTENGLIVSDGERHVQVWRFPFDPELPALPSACFGSAVADLIHGLGLDATDLQLRVLSYRPRKRAVIEVRAAGRRLFLKVLRPGQIAAVDARHRMLSAAGVPVPRSLGWSDSGLLVLDALPGTTLRSIFESGSSADEQAGAGVAGGGVAGTGSAERLIDLLDALPATVRELPRRTPWAEHAAHYAGIVAAARPGQAARTLSLAAKIAAALPTGEPGDEATHGDFYDGQILVSGTGVSGVLDIDTLGPGRRADDLACMLAHLSVLTTLPIAGAGLARRTLHSWLPVFGRRVDLAELRVRTAGVVMSLATGPSRTREPGWEAAMDARISLVEQWLRGSSGADPENALIGLS